MKKYLCTIDVHILRVFRALASRGPVLAVDAVVHALHLALFTRYRAVDQHPARVSLALFHTGPGGAVPDRM